MSKHYAMLKTHLLFQSVFAGKKTYENFVCMDLNEIVVRHLDTKRAAEAFYNF